MKILCIIPPHIPSYFNLGHHLPVFQIAVYLRKHLLNADVTAIDGAVLNLQWKNISDLLVHRYDLIVMVNDFDGVDNFDRFIYYARKFNTKTKIITCGRLSKQIPSFFIKNYDIDAVVHSGDYEFSVLSYIEYLKNNIDKPIGVQLKNMTDTEVIPGIYISEDDFVMPDVSELPYHAYDILYANDLNKFCGIPHCRELVVPIARGCPIGCFYCDIPSMQGKKERRISVNSTITYIKDCFEQGDFEYVTFYAPTFTLNKEWVRQFCHDVKKLDRIYPWKCTTTLRFLDDELISLMKEAGCFRISLGIETLTPEEKIGLPKCKQDMKDYFIKIVNSCANNKVELNCFLILGLPYDDIKKVTDTINFCLERNIRIRPTIYTPYHTLTPEVKKSDIWKYNRQLFIDDLIDHETELKYYEIFYANKNDKPTQVQKLIKNVC